MNFIERMGQVQRIFKNKLLNLFAYVGGGQHQRFWLVGEGILVVYVLSGQYASRVRGNHSNVLG